jgi:transcriptional regulator with GAF, ATPase, and Fis domain
VRSSPGGRGGGTPAQRTSRGRLESGDARAAIRERLDAGDGVRALSLARSALHEASKAEDEVALQVLAAQAARALGDAPLEVHHLEQAEEAAARGAPASLGAARLQLGLTQLRRGAYREAERVLKDALPVLEDDPEARARAQAALVDARTRAAESLPSQERVRSTFAALAGSKVAKARVFRMLEKLYEVDPEVPVDQLLVRFLDELVEATSAERGFVLLAEPDGLRVRVARDGERHDVVHPHLEVSFSIAREAALEGRTLLAQKPAEDPRFSKSRSARRLGLKAVCAAPIRFRRETMGVVVLDRRTSEGGFDRTAELLATDFARGAAGLIFRARRQDAGRAAHSALLAELVQEAEHVRRHFKAPRIVGSSAPVVFMLRLLEKVARTDARVLVRGESGTGKELVARTLHDNSPRRQRPFVAVDCGALADTVIEGELFGHARGAYTGAEGGRPGLFLSANRGTLFLDEVANASPKLQVCLLRMLETGEVRPVGSNEARVVDVRVIAATNEDLEGLVAAGRFRLDLLHRLNAFSIVVPPLRDRLEDIPILAREFALEATSGDEKRAGSLLTRRVFSLLHARSWPGNVRELKNVVNELVALGHLPGAPGEPIEKPRRREPAWKDAPEEVPTLREMERRTIQAALAACDGNKLKAARMLGISRRGLYYLLEDHGLATVIVRRR